VSVSVHKMYSLQRDSYPRFSAPFGAIVAGPTMSGKTVFVSNLIKNRANMIDKQIERVVYCYGEWQLKFEDMKDVEFYNGIDAVFTKPDFFDPHVGTLLILDDLAQELANHPKATKLFTQGIHHKNVSVIFIIQNLYKQGKSMRDIQLNCQYLVIFSNPRDVNQIKVLGNQMGLKNLEEAFIKATSKPYEPLIMDLRPNTPNYLRVRANVVPIDTSTKPVSVDDFMRIFVKERTEPSCPRAYVN